VTLYKRATLQGRKQMAKILSESDIKRTRKQATKLERKIYQYGGQYTVQYEAEGQVVASATDGVLSVAERGAEKQLRERGLKAKKRKKTAGQKFTIKMRNGNIATFEQKSNGSYMGQINEPNGDFVAGATRSTSNEMQRWIGEHDK
jgi:hypothetical protein